MPRRAPLPDQQARDDAVRERARNVLVDAGAGTGKTTLIIDRVVDMVAPAARGAEPWDLARIAVITFTRRAAGELRHRLRQKLLESLRAAGGGTRGERLRRALGVVDTAYIGTIHSFADRLLRLRPIEARISPRYEIAEENEELIAETFDRLTHAADGAALAEQIGPNDHADVPLAEVAETFRIASEAGLRFETLELDVRDLIGFDRVVAQMIDSRDVPFVPEPWEPDLGAVKETAREVAAELLRHKGDSVGVRWLLRVGHVLQRAAAAKTLGEVLGLVREAIGRRPSPGYRKGVEFEGAQAPYHQYLDLTKSDGEWRQALLGPLGRWMLVRLARARPAVIALYERVKAEHGVVDQLDLLVKLRDLLQRDRAARAYFQARFDHVFVDEFQDTDPLQCEVAFFLCEDGAHAADWRTVRLRPGSLTIVGDPKQSIYRFRRADVRMYAEAHHLVREQGALPVELVTNFRSRPGVVRFVNEQFREILGEGEGGERFDPESGRVFYEAIAPSPEITDACASIHVLPCAGEGGGITSADDGRAIEAVALARYLRWLVEQSGIRVRDPETKDERPVRYGDVAVLAHVTTKVPLLLRELDALDIGYAAYGGTLFLSTPLVRRYLLGLRAIADHDDGVAEAALLRPPFFALDYVDLASGLRGLDGSAAPAGARERLAEAREIVAALRHDRLVRSPGETATALIERTALGRAAATGPNGPQALESLCEIAFEVARRAAERGLDFDGVTRELRTWVEHPIQLNPPDAADERTVRVMSIHQAKGLEFPVVVVWDAFAQRRGRAGAGWLIGRDADALAIDMDGLGAEYPTEAGLLRTEKALDEAQRERLYYVAATRARDLLVLPQGRSKSPGGLMMTAILRDADESRLRRFDEYRPDAVPRWASGPGEGEAELTGDRALARAVAEARAAVAAGLEEAAARVAEPTGVTTMARLEAAAREGVEAERVDDAPLERRRKAERSRHGPSFGSTVHRAIELALTGAHGDVASWVVLAAREYGLGAELLEEARGDVGRALAAVEKLVAGEEATLEVEYPVCMAGPEGRMLIGYVDLVVVKRDEIVIVDFKTDAPGGEGEVAYREQLSLYREALTGGATTGGRTVACLLAFTASGALVS